MPVLTYQCHTKAFTLLESLMAAGILALIASIALPSYQHLMRKQRRLLAVQGLLARHTAVQFCLHEKRDLKACLQHIWQQTETQAQNTQQRNWYLYNFQQTSPNHYILIAQATHQQRYDKACQRFVLSAEGQQKTYDQNGRLTTPSCW